MKIILSPAKTMQVDTETRKVKNIPDFIFETQKLKNAIQKLSFEQAKKLWGVSDKLTELNYQRFAKIDLEDNLTPAILAYEGLVYKQINVRDFSEQEFKYLNDHLRIISGFYGLVKPMDGIVPYRLEMSNKLMVGEHKNLYEFWGDKLYQNLIDENPTIINLASNEYSQVIERHLKPEDHYIDIKFVYEKDGKYRQLGTDSKRARGNMVRFMAKNNISRLDDLKEFESLDLKYSSELSDNKTLVFLRQ